MKALYALVIIMGVLIIAGFGVVVAEMVKRANAPSTPTVAAPAETTLDLPSGASIAGMTAVADRLALRVTIPGAADRLYFVDPRDGHTSAIVRAGAN